MVKKDIKDLTAEELKKELNKMREASFRSTQILDWIYKKGVSDFGKMVNLPGNLRSKLSRAFFIGSIFLKDSIKSSDGTEKFLFELSDGKFIESVLISSGERKTLCLSTQVGCKYGCAFCASGAKGFVRDLSASEIISQILFFNNRAGLAVTNFVFMGMGEPLDNYENVSKAIIIMNSREALNIGARRITVSTCGVVPGIQKMRKLELQVNLSISLHASDDKLRNDIVPVNRIYPLEKLIAACKEYLKDNGRMITLEYVLIKGKNDSAADAAGLSKIARTLNAKINLIPYSPVLRKRFKTPSEKDADTFKNLLVKQKCNVTIRRSKGADIKAACGQLAIKTQS